MCTMGELANFIEKRKWIQGKYRNGKGGYCLVGAMISSCPHEWGPLYNQVEAKLIALYPESNPIDWNDEKGRTKDEVLALLRG